MQAIRPKVQWLADETVKAIIGEARQVLAEIGIFVENKTATSLLLEAGSSLSSDDKRILFADELVDKALSMAPSCVRLFNRDGNESMALEGDRVHFNPGSSALHVHDPVVVHQAIDVHDSGPDGPEEGPIDHEVRRHPVVDVGGVQQTVFTDSRRPRTLGGKLRAAAQRVVFPALGHSDEQVQLKLGSFEGADLFSVVTRTFVKMHVNARGRIVA